MNERRSLEKVQAHGAKPAPAPEHPLERRARLRIEEAEARWRRVREMVLVGTAVFVIIDICLMSTLLICAPTAASDKQAGMFLLSQIVSILLGAVLGKTVRLGK